jgi:cation diffusion facilitator CzcD-associated flavoprotein CzcO
MSGTIPSSIYEVAIIGAGFGGIGLAIQLKQAGIHSFVLLEQAAEVGGVWRDNIYPGAACDVASHVYSFSFEPNPRWTRSFSPQQEILDYIKYCTDKHQLRDSIKFNTKIDGLSFDQEQGTWTLHTQTPLRARVVINAVGALNIPSLPTIKGLSTFQGKTMHTAQWDKQYSLAGKTVAVIGTGASAIQVVPSIQKTVKHLILFQRTPAWVLPKSDRAYRATEKKLFTRLPFFQRGYRRLIYGLNELVFPVFLWNSPLTRLAERFARGHLLRSIKDPQLRKQLTPHYTLGCKRVLLSNDYYAALAQDNVSVVSENIEALNTKGIVTDDGHQHDVDIIIFATGFQVPSAGAPFEIQGRGGCSLAEDWAQGCEAFKGISTSGYPNLLTVMGPNTGPGHTSVLHYMESQFSYILQYVRSLKINNIKYLDVRKSVQDQFNRRVQKRMSTTVWSSGCSSWYLAPNGKNTTLWPGFSWEYRLTTARFRLSDYEVEIG